MNNKNFSLMILKELEEFRIKLEKGEIQEGYADWVIRMCEAKIACHFFSERKKWTKLIKNGGICNVGNKSI